MTVQLPTLVDRIEDMGLLLRSLLDLSAEPILGRGAAWALLLSSWPQNIRQLRNALVRAQTLAGGEAIQLEHLPPEIRDVPRETQASVGPASMSGDEADRRGRLVEALEKTQGNVSKTAEILGLSRNSTHRWLKKFQIDPESFRGRGND